MRKKIVAAVCAASLALAMPVVAFADPEEGEIQEPETVTEVTDGDEATDGYKLVSDTAEYVLGSGQLDMYTLVTPTMDPEQYALDCRVVEGDGVIVNTENGNTAFVADAEGETVVRVIAINMEDATDVDLGTVTITAVAAPEENGDDDATSTTDEGEEKADENGTTLTDEEQAKKVEEELAEQDEMTSPITGQRF